MGGKWASCRSIGRRTARRRANRARSLRSAEGPSDTATAGSKPRSAFFLGRVLKSLASAGRSARIDWIDTETDSQFSALSRLTASRCVRPSWLIPASRSAPCVAANPRSFLRSSGRWTTFSVSERSACATDADLRCCGPAAHASSASAAARFAFVATSGSKCSSCPPPSRPSRSPRVRRRPSLGDARTCGALRLRRNPRQRPATSAAGASTHVACC